MFVWGFYDDGGAYTTPASIYFFLLGAFPSVAPALLSAGVDEFGLLSVAPAFEISV